MFPPRDRDQVFERLDDEIDAMLAVEGGGDHETPVSALLLHPHPEARAAGLRLLGRTASPSMLLDVLQQDADWKPRCTAVSFISLNETSIAILCSICATDSDEIVTDAIRGRLSSEGIRAPDLDTGEAARRVGGWLEAHGESDFASAIRHGSGTGLVSISRDASVALSRVAMARATYKGNVYAMEDVAKWALLVACCRDAAALGWQRPLLRGLVDWIVLDPGYMTSGSEIDDFMDQSAAPVVDWDDPRRVYLFPGLRTSSGSERGPRRPAPR